MFSQYLKDNKERFLNELLDLLRLPSVSADSNYKKDVLATAEMVRQRLVEAGADNVELCPTVGKLGSMILSP